MDKKPIQHPQLRLKEALKSCRRKGTLDAFLACISLANEFGIGDESLYAAWQELGGSILGSGEALTLSDTLGVWLAKCYFFGSPAEEQPTQTVIDSEPNPSTAKIGDRTVEELLRDTFATLDATQQRERDAANPYGRFYPAWETEELLQKHFSANEDPGAVIGRYIRSFFPDDDPPEPELHWHADAELRRCSRPLLQLVLASICLSLADRLSVDVPTDRREIDPDADEVALLRRIREANRDASEIRRRIDAANGYQMMAGELLTIAQGTRAEQTANAEEALKRFVQICRSPQPLAAALLRLHTRHAWWIEDAHLPWILQALSSSPLGKHRICVDDVWQNAPEVLGEDAFNPMRLASIPWAVAFKIIEHIEDEEWYEKYGERASDVEDAVMRIVRRWLAEVHHHHGGRSPVSINVLNLSMLHYPIAHLGARDYNNSDFDWHREQRKALMKTFNHDLWLTIGMEWSPDVHPLGFYKYLNYPDYSHLDSDFFLETRPARYIEIIDSALAEGYDELANAYLAFGIFSQAMTGFSVAGWPKRRLAALIARSTRAPGGDMVRKAIEIASASPVREEFRATHAWLASHVKAQYVGEVSIRPVGWTRSEIEEKLKNDLGAECWLWLFPKTKNYLIDAEVTYSRCHIDLGTGIVDYGGVTSVYCKALESELVERYKPLFATEEYRSYKNANNLKSPETLGTVVELISRHDRLPTDLQDLVRSQGLLAHEDPEIVRWLRFCKDVRNKAAHPSQFKSADFVETREISTKIYKRLMSRMT